MNNNAANSLLKTLEEPPGDTLLILIADKAGRLPATIFSRCQRIALHVPTEAEGLDWLERLQPGQNWSEALRMAGLAPLGALAAAELLDTSKQMRREFAALAVGDASPVDIARTWAKLDPAFVLQWLARQVHGLVIGAAGAANGAPQSIVADSVLQRIDSRNLFCYLDSINRLRGQAGGSFNVQLALEGLLIDWATGLQDTRGTGVVPSSPLAIARGA
jgi:DNA polymerase-3 subunit delta'